MKNFLLFLFTFFLSVNFLTAQITWEQTNGPFGGLSNAIAAGDNGWVFAIYHEAGIDSTVFTLYRSGDYGSTWERTDLSGTTLYNIEVSDTGYVFAFFEHSILRSTNNGENWEEVLTTENQAPTTLINSNDGKLFAGGNDLYMSIDDGASWVLRDTSYNHHVAINSQGQLLRVIEPGLFMSEDDGETWTQIANLGFTYDITEIAVNADDEILLGTGWDGLYKASPDGSQWVQLNNFYDINSIEITATGTIYCETYISRLWVSYDDGITWVYQNEGLSTLTIPDIDSDNEGHVYLGTEEGIYKSDDDGYTWYAANTGVLLANVTSVVSAPDGVLYAAVRTGIFKSPDSGESWERIYTIDFESAIEYLYTDSNGDLYVIQYVTRYDKGDISDSCNFYYCSRLFRTSDNGESWTELFNAATMGNLAFSSEGHLYIASSLGLMRSADNGLTWEQVYDNSSGVAKVAIDTSDVIYVLSDSLFRSQDLGETWVSLPVEAGNYLDMQTNTSGSVYTHSFVYNETGNIHILRVSHDMGQTWSTLSSQDTSAVFNLFIGNFDFVYLATSTGLYQSRDLGQNFNLLNGNLPVEEIKDVTENLSGYLFVAAKDRSIWESGTFVNTTNLAPSNQEIFIYPNPASKSVTISYIGNQKADLIIYNNQGIAVKYFSHDQPQENIDISGLVPGIYFMKLLDKNAVGKLVVISQPTY